MGWRGVENVWEFLRRGVEQNEVRDIYVLLGVVVGWIEIGD